MAYERQNFTDGQVLKAEHLKCIEDSLCEASTVADSFKFSEGCIGKTVRILEVNETGQPTKWETVDPQAEAEAILAKAKESGEFDGEDGEPGPPGPPGPAGSDVTDAIRYAPQTLTEEQKAQARENIGAITVPLYVNLTMTNVNGKEGYGDVDKTDAEIEEAYQEGREIYCVVTLAEIPLLCPLAARVYDGVVWLFNLVGLMPNAANATAGYVMVSGGMGQFKMVTMPNTGDIPKTLPNPYSLTINGTTYDGSEPVTQKSALYVTLNSDNTSDKTVAEIYAAYQAGYAIWCKVAAMGNVVIPLLMSNESVAGFGGIAGDSSIMVQITDAQSGLVNTQIPSDDKINSMIDDKIENIDIPTALKNPNALTINGTSYDGSNPASFDLAKKDQGIYYIEGTGSTAGTWLGSHVDIKAYTPGLTVLYKVPVAGASTTTLNINGLGDVPVVRNATTAISTTCPVSSVVMLTYTEDSGTAYWKRADYDVNTKTTTGTSNKTGTKLFLTGAASQTSSGTTTYSNTNCYIGTDNRLYSGGAVVPNTDEINALIDAKISAITNAEEVAF